MASAIRFKQTSVPRQPGELARLKVIHGPDSGAVYVLIAGRASLGRGEENDIVILDLKASRTHAEMNAMARGWVIKDKGSANGIIHNGKTTRETLLKNKDTITLGETTLEFFSSEAGTMMLVAPPTTLAQIQNNQKQVAQHQEKFNAMGLGANPSKQGSANSSRPRLILFGVLGLGAVLFLLDSGTQPSNPARKNASETKKQDLASYLPNAEVNKATETLFKDGFREYLSGNYNRARTQFETVLQIAPDHKLAGLYRENCENAIKNEVTLNITGGKRAYSAGKLKDARAHFERVMRLLYKDQTNPSFIEAKELLEKVTKTMSGEGTSS